MNAGVHCPASQMAPAGQSPSSLVKGSAPPMAKQFPASLTAITVIPVAARGIRMGDQEEISPSWMA